MGELLSFANRLEKVNLKRALKNILLQAETQKFIISLNTDDQLFNKGQDSEGVNLEDIGGEYSPFTEEQKIRDGLPFNRVTLFQKGDFYATFRIEVGNGHFDIVANTIKDGVDLQDRWGIKILGLNEKNTAKILLFIERKIADHILNLF